MMARALLDKLPSNHTVTRMKTTLDLPDDLLIEAKTIAARRRISLKAMVEHALRREIEPTTLRQNTA
jgi:purine-nucleoside phosphorylase